MYQPFWVFWLVLTWINWRVLPLARSRSTAHFAACWLFLSLSTATMVELSFPSSGSPLCDVVEKAERYISQLSDQEMKQQMTEIGKMEGRERDKRGILSLLLSLCLFLLGTLLVPYCCNQAVRNCIVLLGSLCCFAKFGRSVVVRIFLIFCGSCFPGCYVRTV